jgi:cytochrome c oxidase assembly protein subunit 15
MRRVAWLIAALTLLQVFFGGLMAGSNAGLSFNTWPLLDGSWVPSGLLTMSPVWVNVFENVQLIQFDHRMTAYLLLAVVFLHAVQAWRTEFSGPANALALLATAQALGAAAVGVAAPGGGGADSDRRRNACACHEPTHAN